MARFYELECAARDVIQNVKEIQDLRHARLSVIGGLALWHYLPEYRSTDNINFITNISTSPSSLKKRLLERPESPFFQRSQALFYRGSHGEEIRVDISPEWLSPYLPESAVKVQEISSDEIPYISLTDLIVFKLDSSGLRSNPIKKERDARDAAALVNLATNDGTIQLSEKQEQVVEEALCDVAKCGTKEKGWWEKQMGMVDPLDGNRGTTSQRKGRPHSKSDPSPSRTPINNDPNAAWHYERLDHAHMRRFTSLHSSRNSGRPGLGRSSSQRFIRDTGLTMTQPKTSHASIQNGAKRSELINEIKLDSDYDTGHREQFYTIEPGEGFSEGVSRGGYFDSPRTPPGGLGVVTEQTSVVLRRTSKVAYHDLSPGPPPSTVVQPRRPSLHEGRSVSFLL